MGIPYAFYLPENPTFTILDSAIASARFATKVSETTEAGDLRCISPDADPDGKMYPLRGHFVEGVGYCTDAVFAANQLIRFGQLLSSPDLISVGVRLARHVLLTGFFDDGEIPIRMYRDSNSAEFMDDLEGEGEHLELGHMARVAHQLLALAEVIDDADMAAKATAASLRFADWLEGVQLCDNGWYPRRSSRDGSVYRLAPRAIGPVTLVGPLKPDPVWDISGCGALILQFLAALQRTGLRDVSTSLARGVETFIQGGGYFGSVNTDTEDPRENVAYAMAFLAINDAAKVLNVDRWTTFAYESCLGPLSDFEMCEDVNGLETKGLLWMEHNWNSACMWEIAEAAEAYMVAYADRAQRGHLLKALTMLRGMAKHHHGPHGFLTEAVDWDGHSTVLRHFEGRRYSDIAVTHPFLNNLHVLEPTVSYLSSHAFRGTLPDGTGEAFYDIEGNLLGAANLGEVAWLPS
jgi:hypothetical protein